MRIDRTRTPAAKAHARTRRNARRIRSAERFLWIAFAPDAGMEG